MRYRKEAIKKGYKFEKKVKEFLEKLGFYVFPSETRFPDWKVKGSFKFFVECKYLSDPKKITSVLNKGKRKAIRKFGLKTPTIFLAFNKGEKIGFRVITSGHRFQTQEVALNWIKSKTK